MKKHIISILTFAILLVFALCACGVHRNTAKNESSSVDIAVGYSLKEMSLRVNSDIVSQKEVSYQDVSVNGNATELIAKQNGKSVSALYLQGFYQKDLEDSEILVGTYTFPKEELEFCLVYEDEKIAVYDLSNYIYQNTMSARIEEAGLNDSEHFEESLSNCISQVNTLIEKTSSVKPQDIQEQPQMNTVNFEL